MNDTSIRVVCRFRPLNKMEISQGGQCCVELGAKSVNIKVCDDNKYDFTFDRVFSSDTTQETIFEDVAIPILESVMNGYNGTIFAYGQTSSGKTYTMEGYSNDGIIPRVMNEIFNMILNASEENEYSIKVSMVEIYNEKVNDLLDQEKVNLQIKEDKHKGIFIQHLTEVYVCSADHMLQVMKKGTSNRTVAATRMNENSSRSHSLFQVYVNQKNTKTDSKKESKLYFIDLAGSEKIAKTNVQGQQLEEAKNINKSLTCLGMVINALTSEKKEHIPYRDSKLTRILSESLGGNSKTTLIIACSMCTYNDRETLSALRFGFRAKSIKNKPIINEEKSIKELIILLDLAEKKIEQQNEMLKNNYQQVDQPKGQSLKLMQQQLQILNQQEQMDKQIKEILGNKLQISNLISEQTDLQSNFEQLNQLFNQAILEKQQLQLQIEKELFKLQDFNIRYNGMKSHMKEFKEDLNFMLVSFQLRKMKYIQSKEDEQTINCYFAQQQEFEKKLSFSINKLLNSIEDVEEFLQDKLKLQDFNQQQQIINNSNSRQNELLSTLTDEDTVSVASFQLQIQTQDYSELERILELSQPDDFSETITKQFKTIQILNQKLIELQQNFDCQKQKNESKELKLNKKIQELLDNFNNQQNSIKKNQELFVLQLQDKAQEVLSLRKKYDQEIKQKQTENTMLKVQMNELEKNLTVSNPTKKILELDSKLKQLIQERQDQFNQQYSYRSKIEQLEKELKTKLKDMVDQKVQIQQLQFQLTQQQIINSQMIEKPQVQQYSGFQQSLGFKQVIVPLKGGGGNAQRFQQQQTIAQFDLNMSICSSAFEISKQTPRVQDFDNSFYGRTIEDFQDILQSNRNQQSKFENLSNTKNKQNYNYGLQNILKQKEYFK